MGHERVGHLPKTQRWREIVANIVPAATANEQIARLTADTIEKVKDRYTNIYNDQGVKAAFQFLLALSVSHKNPKETISFNVSLNDAPSTLQIVKALGDWMRPRIESHEYATLARKAAADTIAHWTREHSKQRDLFGTESNPSRVWASAGSSAGFCQVTRIFFSNFTKRYLRYFLEREASAELSTVAERRQFNERLVRHVDEVSQHAFEIAKITQSFAAGWYAKHAEQHLPSDKEIGGFLAVAFGKMQEELLKESLP